MVRFACDHCPRKGQYRQETLIARFGGDVLMPDVRHLIAECPRKDAPLASTHSPCCETAMFTRGAAKADGDRKAATVTSGTFRLLKFSTWDFFSGDGRGVGSLWRQQRVKIVYVIDDGVV
jgi:hypothetical protein